MLTHEIKYLHNWELLFCCVENNGESNSETRVYFYSISLLLRVFYCFVKSHLEMVSIQGLFCYPRIVSPTFFPFSNLTCFNPFIAFLSTLYDICLFTFTFYYIYTFMTTTAAFPILFVSVPEYDVTSNSVTTYKTWHNQPLIQYFSTLFPHVSHFIFHLDLSLVIDCVVPLFCVVDVTPRKEH